MTMATTEKYLVNLSKEIEVQLMEGNVKIPRGGWLKATKEELEHLDTLYAKRKRWIEVSDKQPDGPEDPEIPSTIVLETQKPMGTTTPPKMVKKEGVRVAAEPEVDSGMKTVERPSIPAVESPMDKVLKKGTAVSEKGTS